MRKTNILISIFFTLYMGTSLACEYKFQSQSIPLSNKLSFNFCFEEVENFNLFEDQEVCDCISKYDVTDQVKKNNSKSDSAEESVKNGLSLLINEVSNLSYSMIKYDVVSDKLTNDGKNVLEENFCKFDEILNSASCKDTDHFKKVSKKIVSKIESSSFGKLTTKKSNNVAEIFKEYILYKNYDILLSEEVKTRKSCYGANVFSSTFYNSFSSNVENELKIIKDDILTRCKSLQVVVEGFCEKSENSYHNYEVKNLPDGSILNKVEKVNSLNDDPLKSISQIKNLCSLKNKKDEGKKDISEVYPEAGNISISDVIADPVYEINDTVGGLAYYQDGNNVCNEICLDSPGPYPIGGFCKLKDLDVVLKDSGCDLENTEQLDPQKCQLLSNIKSKVLENQLAKESQNISKLVSENEDIKVSSDYKKVFPGVSSTLMKFLGVDRNNKKEMSHITVKPELPVREDLGSVGSKSVVSNPDNTPDSGFSAWSNETSAISKPQVKELKVDSAHRNPILKNKEKKKLSQETRDKVQRLNHLIERLKRSQDESAKYNEHAVRAAKANKDEENYRARSRAMTSFGGFDNNWGVDGNNAARGYNDDGTSFAYPKHILNKFKKKSYSGFSQSSNINNSRSRVSSADQKFSDAMNRRGMTTNISGQGVESVPVDSISGSDNSSSDGGAGLLSRGPASGSSKSSNRLGGENIGQSSISKLFQGITDSKDVRRPTMEEVNIKQVRVFNKDDRIVLEDLLLKHDDIKPGESFIVYELDNGNRKQVKLIPTFGFKGEFEGYKIDDDLLSEKDQLLASRIYASDNFLKK